MAILHVAFIFENNLLAQPNLISYADFEGV
jgi:hypothetical protein